jgi:hypothetical protein
VVAVVHADAGGRAESAPAINRDASLEGAHRLVRAAGERIGVLTMSARAAFGSVMSTPPPAPAQARPVDQPTDAVAAPAQTHASPAAPPDPAAAASIDEAGRYASQLVSQLSRYNLTASASAPVDADLQQKLAGQLEGARSAGAAPPSSSGAALGLFEEALGKMLGDGALDASVSVQPV